ncbi:cytochrome P450 CYP736A12-like [Papaver somniferum]|uniref:cytochrome P450 CYP736A12-like n=1 Tax=Papaver somniferum TaxID=3469 RepID=UPI000E705593|nr:cytochrome P450 CYP736A12-like [Papaver somniferum]
MDSSWITLFMSLFFIAILFLFSYLFLKSLLSKGSYQLPPGPYGLPILGNLHRLGDLPHQNLQKLSLKYGPIMYMRLGLVPAIVVTSPELAELILKTHDIVFASRSILESGKYFGYEQKGLVFKQYGSAWRNIRKLCTLHLLTNSKIESFKSTRESEVRNAVESIKVAADGQVLVNLSLIVESLAEDITHKTIFGSLKNDRYNSKSLIQEAFRLAGAFNVADYIPYIGPLDLQGLARQMKSTGKLVDEFLEHIIDQHIKDHGMSQQDHYQRDFVDILLSLMNAQETTMNNELKLDRENVKAISLDMIGAMMETSATTVQWAISEIIKNTRVMKLVQQELETVVGLDRQVEETDLVKLPYLDMVLKESMRLHPVTPLLIPRESMDDIYINGYHIPKKTRVFVNVWAIGRDKQVWSDNAEEFYPERFIEVDVDMRGKDFRLLPFGSGRRGCPGMQMGLTLVRLMLAQLVHCFNWELPNGMLPHKLEMNEKWGLTVPRANHLMAIPIYRLTK